MVGMKNLFISVLLALAMVVPLPGHAWGKEVDANFQEIESLFMDPELCGETLAQSESSAAEAMRQEIREMLQAGKSQKEIVNKFVDQYGYAILGTPPKQGFFLSAWLLPVAAIMAGTWIIYLFLRRSNGKKVVTRPSSQEDAPFDKLMDKR